MKEAQFPPALLEQLRRQSTCVVATAVESFHLRSPNTGFTDSSVRCLFPDCPTVIGYAVTAKIKSAAPGLSGIAPDYWQPDWWKAIQAVPAPRIAVVEDEDNPPGLGAFVGEVHANILRALGCVALVTNGAVRDLPDVDSCGFQMFAGNVAVSHAYAHLSGFGETVEVGHLRIRPGELLLGDRHGVVSIPAEIAAEVPGVAREILERRHFVVGLCRSQDFSIERLEAAQKDFKLLEQHRAAQPNASSKRGEL